MDANKVRDAIFQVAIVEPTIHAPVVRDSNTGTRPGAKLGAIEESGCMLLKEVAAIQDLAACNVVALRARRRASLHRRAQGAALRVDAGGEDCEGRVETVGWSRTLGDVGAGAEATGPAVERNTVAAWMRCRAAVDTSDKAEHGRLAENIAADVEAALQRKGLARANSRTVGPGAGRCVSLLAVVVVVAFAATAASSATS